MIIEYDNSHPTEIKMSEGNEVSYSSPTISRVTCQWENLTPEIQKEFLKIGQSLEVVSQKCFELLMSDELDPDSVRLTLTPHQEALLRQPLPVKEKE